MKICFFGIFNNQYNRNAVLIKGLRRHGVDVVECSSSEKGIKKYIDLIKKHKKIKERYDILFVAFPGQSVMLLARLLTRKKIVFDAFTSVYDSAVNDRKVVGKYSFKAAYYWLQDFLACFLANKIITDSIENKKYLAKNFHVNEKKISVVYVGCDEEIMRPLSKERNEKFLVHFHGSYIPLQGVKFIISAAELLTQYPIHFNIVGTKIKKEFAAKKNLPNISFYDNVDYNELSNMINQSDLCLGIFGETEKADRVIPNKVFEAMACGKAIITAETKGIKEVFTDKINILFCQRANAQDLADKIRLVFEDRGLMCKISNNAYRLFNQKYRPQEISKLLIDIIK